MTRRFAAIPASSRTTPTSTAGSQSTTPESWGRRSPGRTGVHDAHGARVPLGRPYKLAALAERLDVLDRGSHRVLDDCRATIGVYRAVHRLLGGVSLAPLVPPDAGPAPTEVAYDADLSGQAFGFTGFRDEVLAARIGIAGGTVAGRISRKVTTLLVADADAKPTGKVKKAIECDFAVGARRVRRAAGSGGSGTAPRCRTSSPPPPWSGSGRRSWSTTGKWRRF